MYNHATENYVCPICLGIQGIKSEKTLIEQSDIVYKDKFITCFISSFFIGNNPGHIIIVPNKHFENVYDLSADLLEKINLKAKEIAFVLKQAYECEGVTILQNNEPASDQHAFHYHLHVFPRYENDELHKKMFEKKIATTQEKLEYANKINKYLQEEK